MTNEIDYRRVEAAMQQGRVERALAFRGMAKATYRALRATAKMIVAIVT